MHSSKTIFNGASNGHWNRRMYNNAFDGLASALWFATEAESIQPENVAKTKEAFIRFLDKLNMPLAKWSFEELLAEKTGEFEFRADKKTPNWYHEFRECLYFLAMVRAGLIHEEEIRGYGGVEAALGITLRHDSWEDLGKDRIKIYAPLEKKIHELDEMRSLGEVRMFRMRCMSVAIIEGVDLLTRKTPKLNEDGNFVRKPTGKLVKVDRFGGQLNLYYNQILKSPLTALAKFFDGIEGMSTRVGVLDFSVDDDRKYTDERRMLFGRRPLDQQAIDKYPFLKPAIRSADAMLGILLTGMETLNDYGLDRGENPEYAAPIRISQYLPAATKGFKFLPPAFHPISIFMERMRAKAARENDGRVETLISRALLPSLAPHFGQINIYGKVTILPEVSVSAPTMP